MTEITRLTDFSLQNILQYLLEENIRIKNEAAKFLKTAPKSCLCCDRRCKRPHYRHRIQVDGHSKDTFLTEKDNKLIEMLSLKHFYKRSYKYSSGNIKIIENSLGKIIQDVRQQSLSELPVGIREIASSVINSRQQWMKDWMYSDYKTNGLYPENRTIKTISGIYVRTKSEEKIADSLTNAGLVFRYEPMLIIDGVVRFPDFVILHPASTPKHLILIIWEHAGMLDDLEKYEPEAFKKLHLYARNGLIFNLNMIYTTETRSERLSTDTVKLEISRIFSMDKGSPIVEVDGCYEIAD